MCQSKKNNRETCNPGVLLTVRPISVGTITHFPLYTNLMDFHQKNQDVIEVQMFSFNLSSLTKALISAFTNYRRFYTEYTIFRGPNITGETHAILSVKSIFYAWMKLYKCIISRHHEILHFPL